MSTPDNDPRIWLEDIDGEAALNWVNARNAEAEEQLRSGARFTELRESILEILDSDDRIAAASKVGDYAYNFWRDAEHPRGIWRRAPWAEYLDTHAKPDWDVLLDIDQLNTAEAQDWVWHGASILRPTFDRALISLSHGGSDSDTTREFDLSTRTWISEADGGFVRPDAKGSLSWINCDVALLSTDIGPESTTTSGYPRTVQLWQRGTAMSDAETIITIPQDEMGVFAGYDRTPGFERLYIVEHPSFFTSKTFIANPDGSDLRQIEVPESADVSVHRHLLLVRPRDPWEIAGRTYPSGSLLAINLDQFWAGERDFVVVFEPTETSALVDYTATRSFLVLTILEDVKSRAQFVAWPSHPSDPEDRTELINPSPLGDTGWLTAPLEGVDELVTINGIGPVDAIDSDELTLATSGFLTPTTLSLVRPDGSSQEIASEPERFDPTAMNVAQHFATSADGTKVPYFIVTPAGFEVNGTCPTLLYAYGGFEISLTPNYAGGRGKAWLERGGAFVVANIRGGGEYGPRWHQAALKEKRPRAYEDLAAVARDLVERGVTSPEHLGVQGGSNGGLLTGNMLTQYPELFGAVIIQVPLLDMYRYTKLLAGASWEAEYGDPDDSAQWEFIRAFSPYHLADAERTYPPALVMTSTRDDRVHPGHARKFAELLRELGQDVTYWENIEGGHGGAADNTQAAIMSAQAYEFLWQHLT